MATIHRTIHTKHNPILHRKPNNNINRNRTIHSIRTHTNTMRTRNSPNRLKKK